MAQHSSIVGGSTASRVIGCPASVGLTAQMPKKPAGKDADAGTLLHEAIALILEEKATITSVEGLQYNGITLDDEMIAGRLLPALEQFDDLIGDAEFMVEQQVSYGSLIPGAFGTADVIARDGNRAICLDWKFGQGVPVSAVENSQMAYYSDAARLTSKTMWAFDGVDEVEFIIVQPSMGPPSRWVTTPKYLDEFRGKLLLALKLAADPLPPINPGHHCRWCSAKPICPALNGEAERALATALDNLGDVGPLLEKADLLDAWIKSVNELAQQVLEAGRPVTGYKLVQKRAIRCWADESQALDTLVKMGLDPITRGLISPAQAEKALKPLKLELPALLVKAVSSGTTVAKDSDPRPGISNVSQKLNLSLSKLNLGN